MIYRILSNNGGNLTNIMRSVCALTALALGLGSAPARATPPAAATTTVTLAPATMVTEDGTRVAFELGTLHVRENRAVAGSAMIDIGFARLRAVHATGAPPIIFLPGGPGASYLDAFTDTTDNARRRLGIFRRYAAVADVVVFDQRGFSRPGTTLELPPGVSAPLDRPSTIAATTAAWREFARASIAANPGHDLAGYTIAACAADVDDLRRALGYRQWSLLATSFGAQESFAVMRLYPETVARAVLSGVEPLDDGYDMPSQVFAALQRIAFDADRAAELQPYLPAGGLIAAVRELRARFARGPVTVRVTDPKTGAPASVVLGLEDLQGALLGHEAEDWPAFVLALYHGHYETWARNEIAERRTPSYSSVINLLIDAATDASPTRKHQLATDPATDYLGTGGFEPSEDSRTAWPVADLGDALRAPVQSPIPVVFLNGDWDTSTPIENMLHIAAYFPNGRAVVVHRGEHAAPTRLTRESPAAFAAILEFFRTGRTAQLPSEITLRPPTFTRPDFPPPTRS